MFVKNFLTPVVEDVEAWARLYELDIITCRCNDCNRLVVTNIPFVSKETVGLYSKCECGSKNTPYTYVYREGRGPKL